MSTDDEIKERVLDAFRRIDIEHDPARQLYQQAVSLIARGVESLVDLIDRLHYEAPVTTTRVQIERAAALAWLWRDLRV